MHLYNGRPLCFNLFAWALNKVLYFSAITGAKYHQRRKLLTPTFHFQILEGFTNEQCAVLVDKLSEKVDQNFDIYPFIALCTLDIICGNHTFY